jgi:hypothetical protein
MKELREAMRYEGRGRQNVRPERPLDIIQPEQPQL